MGEQASARPALFSCSGASNVGELTDRACRRVAETGEAEMLCLTRLGVGEGAAVQASRERRNIVVDGCGEACARKTFERLGLANLQHVCVTDLGIEKRVGTPAREEEVESLAAHLRSLAVKR